MSCNFFRHFELGILSTISEIFEEIRIRSGAKYGPKTGSKIKKNTLLSHL